jgi:SAM-dependent methyltransferase
MNTELRTSMVSDEGWPETIRRIRIKFKNGAQKWWWGDHLDGRFLLAKMARRIVRGPVLDIGCGPGVILSEVDRGALKAGLDIDRQALKVAADFNPEAFLAAADWGSLPFKTDGFSTVILSGVICASLPREVKDKILKEAVRVLKPGGQVLIFDINRDHWAAGRFNPLLLNHEGLTELLTEYGLEVKTTVGWNPLPSLVWFLPKRLKKKIAAKNHRYKYFIIPSILLPTIPGLPEILHRIGRTPLFKHRAKSYVVQARSTGSMEN